MHTMTEQVEELVEKIIIESDPASLDMYSHDQSFTEPVLPQGVVKPINLEEVQQIISWANQTRTPLVPISSGSPHFRGDTVPGTPDAIMVDLREMNRIIRVNRKNRVAIIEPGVTFGQLQPELAKKGLRISHPLLPRSNKSVIAALLEREPTLIPRLQWSFLDPLRCIQVVWGDGNTMTTGDAESAGTLEEEWEKGYAQLIPSGPQQTDFYKVVSAAQGSMGIVTWASVKCEMLPEIHKLYFVPSADLNNLIDPLYKILRIRFGDELFIVNSWQLASMLGNNEDQIKHLAEKLPSWVLLVGIAGRYILTEEKVDYQKKDISEIVHQSGLELLPSVSGVEGDEVLKVMLNPSPEPYWKFACKGGCQDFFFLSTLEKSPDFVKTMQSVAETNSFPTTEIGVYIQPVHQGASCHIEFSLPYDQNNKEEVSRMRELYMKGSEKLHNQGAFFSRPYGIWSDMAFNRDKHTAAILTKLKGVFDPNSIMNPGKLCY